MTAQSKRLTNMLLAELAQQACQRSRLRQNYNFHDESETVQRLLNALQPGTYVRPHRHLRPPGKNGFEFFLVLQGALGVLILDEQGEILQQELLQAQGPVRALELTEGTYHTLVALTPDTVILELKEGPYDATTDKAFLPMFPEEGTPAAQQLVATWTQRFAALLLPDS
jgi:cupin fold WbuC family metalloprotein